MMTEGFGRLFFDALLRQLTLLTQKLHMLLRIGVPERMKPEAFRRARLLGGFYLIRSVRILKLALVIVEPVFQTFLFFVNTVFVTVAKQIIVGVLVTEQWVC